MTVAMEIGRGQLWAAMGIGLATDTYAGDVADLRLPSELTELDLSVASIVPIEALRLPNRLRTLRLPDQLDQSIEQLQLPASLTDLRLPQAAGTLMALPVSLSFTAITELRWIGSAYANSLPRSRQWLPPTVRKLTLPRIGSSAEDVHVSLSDLLLSASLEDLTVDLHWLTFLTLPLPSGLRALTVFFHRLMDAAYVGFGYDARAARPLHPPPPVLVDLHPVKWPAQLQRLSLAGFHSQSERPLVFEGALPSVLKELVLQTESAFTFVRLSMPPLDLLDVCAHRVHAEHAYEFYGLFAKDALPVECAMLHLRQCKQSLREWPLPVNLRQLVLGAWQQPASELPQLAVPSSRLKVLDLGDAFDQQVEELTLPASLKVLRFGWAFSQSVVSLRLPSSLEELEFGAIHSLRSQFNQPLVGLQLPSELRILRVVGAQYQQPHGQVWPQLPASLRLFHVHSRESMRSSWSHTEIPPQCVLQFGQLRRPLLPLLEQHD